jgi:hypothetical protein
MKEKNTTFQTETTTTPFLDISGRETGRERGKTLITHSWIEKWTRTAPQHEEKY